jgi:cytochrome c553
MGRTCAAVLQAVSLGFAAVTCSSVWAQQASAPAAPTAASAAAPAPLSAALKRGKDLSYTCLGCHGIDGYRNAYPNYSVPKLEGQHPEYLVTALHGYRDGDRSHITMHSQAETLSDQDMLDIASFFAGTPLVPSDKPVEAVPKSAQLCTSCHGRTGIAIAPMYPSLAGQHEDYLRRAIEEYQKGGRKNPIMTALAANLSAQDVAEISGYFSRLTPALRTENRPYTRYSESETP